MAATIQIASKNDIYRELLFLFDLSDKKYNSGLFSQKHDSLMRNILLDDDTLKKIILDLYPPNSEYNFAVLSVEILGSIYEKFLGKIITLTPSGNVKIVEKEDVKIAGGVVYTPEFVVTYIIKNTVGVKIKGLTPKQIEKIKILDPACGSGTFLVKAYNYLLQYHLDYYLKNTAKYKNEIYQINKNKWILSTNIRRRILLNNIFGLDVDSYAVEIYYAKYMDYWYFFTCKALDHLKENGLHSFIPDNNWTANAGGKKFRAKILNDAKIETYVV